MKTFRYYAPSHEEQRGFVMQILGTLLGVVVAGVVFFRADDGGLRALLVGAVLALGVQLARAAWELELKARRAQTATIGVDENGLHLTDIHGAARTLSWDEIGDIGVRGGRLNVAWPGGSLIVGSREIEDGMDLVRLVTHRGKDDEPPRKTNFIPLTPL